MSSYLEIQPFTFDPRPEYPYSLCIKRYTHRDLSAEPADTGAITLILTHGVGLHKEQWEPVLEDLFGLLGTANSIAIGGAKLKIREAWSVELPDCGDSVLLNEKALSDGKGCLTDRWDMYGEALHMLLSGRGKGVEVDFQSHNLVAIATSVTALSIIMTRNYSPTIDWRAAILFEPVLLSSKGEYKMSIPEANIRDAWDERNVELYQKYGRRGTIIAGQSERVVHPKFSATNLQRTMTAFCEAVPTHLVFGNKYDYIPRDDWDILVHKYAGDKLKTVSVIDGAGHLMIQTEPATVAETIWSCLWHPSSKLITSDLTAGSGSHSERKSRL
ncbi:uncharacterized protein STEHIDRAFT_121183 [Stereum hirsutum FP-91666 SS1]|uniref:uncharacterized protein n=1 Tax=Stereum hirsutum (strain FP-91666) TaxID=721885 RepID=UPI000440BAEB|nr:uncharacterized protein STEHIDRAFT_121183 [Stereum hirsutum FP-91666 SS1]EIM87589.1 hypothetical protein STEHIDRAFT_121183 [Stereum hirsutum FP-91666 SS1]